MTRDRKNDLSWMPLHVADWLGSATVARLSLAGRAAYVTLLCHQWRNEGEGLPVDPEALRRMVGWQGRGWPQQWAIMSAQFPEDPDGRTRSNGRLENERSAVAKARQPHVENGRKGGEATARKHRSDDNYGRQVKQKVSAFDATQVVENQRKASSAGAAAVQHPNPNPNLSSSGEEERASASAGLSAQFTDDHHRAAYLGFRRGQRHPESFDALVAGMLNGQSAPGGKPLTAHQIGTALLDMRAAGVLMNANTLRGFARKVPTTPVAAVKPWHRLGAA